MADQHSFTKKWQLLPVPIRLGIGLTVVLLTGLALGAALPWMAQAGPTFAGNASADVIPPDAIKAAQATGACCVEGICIQETEVNCHTSGGDYKGNGILCPEISCDGSPVDACCLADGSCAHMTADACTTAGGVYQGADTDCEHADCPPHCHLRWIHL